jgi:uncharacterized phage protein (TIGR01671 family)
MSKLLKFRVWDRMRELYIFSNSNNQQHFIIDLNGNFYNLQNGSGGKEYIIEQSIGFKDSNNKEVYEGDIVKWEDLVGEIYWSEEDVAFLFRSNDGGTFLNYCYVANFEVIGNIHQNGDILVKSKENEMEDIKKMCKEGEMDIELARCEQCGENAWDGRICHSCGLKEI